MVKDGFEIIDLNETFFYFIKRSQNSSLNRYKNETISEYRLYDKKFPSTIYSIASFFKKLIVTNSINYFKTIWYDYKVLKIKFEIYKKVK